MRIERLALIILLNLSAMSSYTQSQEPLLEIWEMSDDIDSLYAQLMEAHPDPFFFASTIKLHQAYYDICSQLDHSMSRFEFAGIANQLTKTIEDSHTGIDYLQLAPLAFEENKNIIPINIVTDANQRLLVRTAWDSLLTPGWEISCINGRDAMEAYMIALHRFSYTEADALLSKYRVSDALWPIIAANIMDLDTINEIEMVHPYTGEIRTVQSRGYDSKQYYKIRKERAKLGVYDSFRFEINGEKDYAYLRVGTFAPQLKDKYRRQIRKAFVEISNSGVHHLILDISGNGGGSSNNVEYLYSFLDSTGYNTPKNVIGINSRLSQQRAKAAANRTVRWFMRNFWSRDEDVRGYLQIADLPLGERDTAYFNEPIRQKKYVFNDKVYLLINGMTASAGVDFTQAFKARHRGIVIGEPCMGPNTGTFGNPAIYRLPNSELTFYIATIRYNYDGSFMPSRIPIAPDVFVEISAMDIENNKNSLIEAALHQFIDQ